MEVIKWFAIIFVAWFAVCAAIEVWFHIRRKRAKERLQNDNQ